MDISASSPLAAGSLLHPLAFRFLEQDLLQNQLFQKLFRLFPQHVLVGSRNFRYFSAELGHGNASFVDQASFSLSGFQANNFK